MKLTSFLLGMIAMAFAVSCSHNDSTTMAPLSESNRADLQKTLAAFADVNDAVMAANDARSGQATTTSAKPISTTPTRKDPFNLPNQLTQYIGLSATTQNPKVLSLKAQSMSEKIQSEDCSITTTDLEQLKNSIATKSIDFNNVNMHMTVSGDACPIYYDLEVQISKPAANQDVVTLTFNFQAKTSDFKSDSEIQSIQLKLQMTSVSNSDESGSATLSGSGTISSSTQGQIGIYSSGGASGDKNTVNTDAHFGLTYPSFKADLHVVGDLASKQKNAVKIYLNDRAITQEDVESFSVSSDKIPDPIPTPTPSATPVPGPSPDPIPSPLPPTDPTPTPVPMPKTGKAMAPIKTSSQKSTISKK